MLKLKLMKKIYSVNQFLQKRYLKAIVRLLSIFFIFIEAIT